MTNEQVIMRLHAPQKYQFAEAYVVFKNDKKGEPELKLFSLKPKEYIEKENDDEVFYYCNNYEEFLELLSYTQNEADFNVYSVVGLY